MELIPEATEVVAKAADSDDGADAYAPSVQRLLHLLRVHVGMDVAWTSEFVGAHQIFRFVDVEPGKSGPQPGSELPRSQVYCSYVLSGQMPSVIPDSRTEPLAALLPATSEFRIGAYLGVPLLAPDGNVEGMLCTVSTASAPSLSERDLASARLIADLIEDLHRRALGSAEATRRRAELHSSVSQICAGHGRRAVLQPIIDTHSGAVLAAEGLTRFESTVRDPAQWFAAADTVGLRRDLELGTAAAIIARLDAADPPPAVAVNVSPDLVADACLGDLLSPVDPGRVIVEITEHAPVASYDDLHRALEPLRAQGLRVAVDDAGAGYASMTHVLRLRPDFIKMDMSLIRGVDTDRVRRALVAAMTAFGRETDAAVIAEGVETPAELAALVGIGVPYAQGYLFGQPTEQPSWSDYDVQPS